MKMEVCKTRFSIHFISIRGTTSQPCFISIDLLGPRKLEPKHDGYPVVVGGTKLKEEGQEPMSSENQFEDLLVANIVRNIKQEPYEEEDKPDKIFITQEIYREFKEIKEENLMTEGEDGENMCVSLIINKTKSQYTHKNQHN